MDKRLCLIAVSAMALWLAGCVQETTYVGRNGPPLQQFEPKAAAKTRMELALSYLAQGNMVQARANLDKALNYEPDNPVINAALAYFYQQVGEPVKADITYRKALDLAPDNARVLNSYGVFLCEQKRYSQAEKMFLHAIRVPKYTRVASTYENAAICALSSGNSAKAKDYYQHALGYSPANSKYLLALAELAYGAEDYATAKGYMSRYDAKAKAKASPDSLWLELRLAQAEQRIARVHQLGGELVNKFPKSVQAKKYLANEY